jgi:predicted acylesterase/phospholipase RssA
MSADAAHPPSPVASAAKKAAFALPLWAGKRVDVALEHLGGAWLVLAVGAGTFLSLGVVPMTSDQAREALLSYLPQGGPDPRGLNLPALAASLFGIWLLSGSLRYWGARMMGAAHGEATAARGSLLAGGWIVPAVWYAPWAGLGLLLRRTADELSGWWSLAADFAGVVALIAPIALALLWMSPPGRALQTVLRERGVLHQPIAWFQPALFAGGVALFGFPGDAEDGLARPALHFARALGPVALVSIELAVMTAFGAWLIVHGRRLKAPLFLLAAAVPAVLTATGRADNHAITVTAAPPDEPTALLPQAQALAQWEAWKDPAPAGAAPAPVILVAASGGGVRAAYFTAAVLGRIADQCPDAARRIFAVSGVSGGAIGAAAYAAALKVEPLPPGLHGCAFTDAEPGPYERRLAAVFARDHLSPVMARGLFADVAQRAVPAPIESFDRQRALESSVADGFSRAFGAEGLKGPFHALRPDAGRPDVPYLLMNTTTTGGERVVGTSVWPASDPDGAATVLSRRFPKAEPSVAAMAGASARFTYVSPSGYLEGPEGRTRFVDGGYFDNTGLTTLTDLYRDLKADPATAERPVIVLVLDSAPACEATRCTGGPAPQGTAFEEALAPLMTLIATRDAHEARAAREMDAAMTAADPVRTKDAVIRVGLRRQMLSVNGGPAREIAVPLGWLLSPVASGAVRGQIDAAPGPDCVAALRRSGAGERGYAVLQDDGTALAGGTVRDDCAYAALAARLAPVPVAAPVLKVKPAPKPALRGAAPSPPRRRPDPFPYGLRAALG